VDTDRCRAQDRASTSTTVEAFMLEGLL
jgi:hypothetical protein